MRVLDLFSGIGGFSLGLERAGMKTVAFCEIEPFARRVLAKHWPGVPIYDDVRALTGELLWADGIAVDVICGGFPCQDISQAGKRAGLAGERSGLWREFARLIGELRPRYVIVENVAALLGRGLGDVLGDLATLGYDAEWHCIPASAVGAPHRRDRIWIVANPNRSGCERPGQTQPARRKRKAKSTRPGEDVADTDCGHVEWRSGDVQMGWGRFAGEALKNGDDRRNEWAAKSRICRMANGFSQKLDGVINAENCKGRPNKALQSLRNDYCAQTLQWQTGGSQRFLETQVLQQEMYGRLDAERGSNKVGDTKASLKNAGESLRALRNGAKSGDPPRGSQLEEQQPIEFDDAVQFVSHDIASQTGRSCTETTAYAMQGLRQALVSIGAMQHSSHAPAEVWKSLSDTEAHWTIVAASSGIWWSEWPDVKRTRRNVKNQVDRLRGLGNALLPQIPELIGKALMEAACRKD
jgi:DNA (cytosine-5)-methyltransferase 1